MNRRLHFTIAVLITIRLSTAGGSAAAPAPPALLRDGFVMQAVDGKLLSEPATGVFLFELASDVNDFGTVVKAGARLELLPSATLEKLATDAAGNPDSTYRLWARVTKYKGKNYIFPIYFLPTTSVAEPAKDQTQAQPVAPPDKPAVQPADGAPTPSDKDSQRRGVESAAIDPNKLEIPKEVLEQLKAPKVVRPRVEPPQPAPAQEKQPVVEQPSAQKTPSADVRQTPGEPATRQDLILVDRMAALVQHDGQFSFLLEAYGLKVQEVSLRLLPCEALELTEQRCTASPERLLFKIAGIRTKYQGQGYLLLQRATRIYSHDNFRTFVPD
jgi:hypothetical protein